MNTQAQAKPAEQSIMRLMQGDAFSSHLGVVITHALTELGVGDQELPEDVYTRIALETSDYSAAFAEVLRDGGKEGLNVQGLAAEMMICTPQILGGVIETAVRVLVDHFKSEGDDESWDAVCWNVQQNSEVQWHARAVARFARNYTEEEFGE